MAGTHAAGRRAQEGRKPLRARGRPPGELAARIGQELLDVALRLFVERGYGATTMLDIIKAAGVSKTTIYSRFASTEQIFRAIMSRQAERFAAALPFDVSDATLTLEDALTRFANYLFKTTLEGTSLEVHRLLYSEARRFPELGIAAVERHRLGVSRIARLIAVCGEREGMPCKNAEVPAELFILFINGWYTNLLLSGRKVTEAERTEFVRQIVAAVLSGRPGW